VNSTGVRAIASPFLIVIFDVCLYVDLPFFFQIRQRARWDTAPYVALMRNRPSPIYPLLPTPSFPLYAPLLILFIRTRP